MRGWYCSVKVTQDLHLASITYMCLQGIESWCLVDHFQFPSSAKLEDVGALVIHVIMYAPSKFGTWISYFPLILLVEPDSCEDMFEAVPC